jgi:hypothetical protein
LRVSDDGTLSVLDNAGAKLSGLGSAAGGASGGFSSLVSGMADVKGAVDVIGGALTQGMGLIEQFNDLGVASLRAKNSLDVLSGGSSAGYLDGMRSATKGLVDDMTLASVASQALSSGVVHSSEGMAELARDGATLGLALKGDAVGGIEDMKRALEGVGNVRALRTLGIDAQEVKTKFETLKTTMSDKDAWEMAVLDVAGQRASQLAGSLDGAGTAADRLKTRFSDAMQNIGERVSIGIDAILRLNDAMAEHAANDKTPVSGNTVKVSPTEEITFDANGMPIYMPTDKTGGVVNTPQQPSPIGWGSVIPQQPQQPGWGSMVAPPPTIGMDQFAAANAASRTIGLDEFAAANGGNGNTDVDAIYAAMRQQKTGSKQGLVDKENQQYDTIAGADMLRNLMGNMGKGIQNTALDAQVGYEGAVKASDDDRAAGAKMLQGLIKQGADAWVGFQAAADKATQPIRDQVALLEHRNQIQSVAQAFGLKKDGMYAEMDTLGADAAAARQNRMAEDTKKGMSKGAIDADMAKFDSDAKKAMDEYNIATGAATRESIAFNDARKALSQQAATGKITIEQEKNALLALANAAKDGSKDLATLEYAATKMNKRESMDSIVTGQKNLGKKMDKLDKQDMGEDGKYNSHDRIQSGDAYTKAEQKATEKMKALEKMDTEGTAKTMGTLQQTTASVDRKFKTLDAGMPEHRDSIVSGDVYEARKKQADRKGDQLGKMDSGLGSGKPDPKWDDPFKGASQSADKAKGSFNDVSAAADKAKGSIGGLGDAATPSVAKLALAAILAAASLAPIVGKANEAQGAVGGIGAALKGLAGTLTIAVGFTGNGSSRGSTNGIRGGAMQ